MRSSVRLIGYLVSGSIATICFLICFIASKTPNVDMNYWGVPLVIGLLSLVFLIVWFFIGVGDKIIAKDNTASRATAAIAASVAATRADIQNGGGTQQPQKPIDLTKETVLGKAISTQQQIAVPDTDRQSGLYMLGVQGVGKSSLLESMIFQDIRKGQAVIVLDPHADLIEHVIAQMPPDKLQKTYLLDMEDESFPFGVNLFTMKKASSSIQEAQAVDRVMHVFEALWGDVLSQQNLPRYLRGATLALLQNQGSTLVDMYTFLQDDAYRSRLLKNVKDISVRDFWQYQYDDLTPAARRREVAPLVNRLESLFMGRSLIRNILGQTQTTIDFRRAIENKEIILIKLPLRVLEQDAKLIGTMLVAQIHSAIFSYADTPLERRPGFSFYIDEFQNFVTKDIEEIFTQGRKFGARLSIAHQARYQIPDFLEGATLTARTKITFQSTQTDARTMAPLYVQEVQTLRKEDIDPHPAKFLLTYGSSQPEIEQFIKTYLRPVSMQARGNHITVKNWKPTWLQDQFEGGDIPPEVPNPIPLLDALFYEVETKKDPTLSIPFDIVKGFSDVQGGYWRVLDKASQQTKYSLCSPEMINPQYRAKARSGLHGDNQKIKLLLDVIISLRQVMVMLAKNPIGEAQQQTPAEVAQEIVNLPRRRAYVRIGQDVTLMETYNTPAAASGPEHNRRKYLIQGQTRQTYCKDRGVVEQEMLAKRNSTTATQQPQPGANATNTAQPDQVTPRQRFVEE